MKKLTIALLALMTLTAWAGEKEDRKYIYTIKAPEGDKWYSIKIPSIQISPYGVIEVETPRMEWIRFTRCGLSIYPNMPNRIEDLMLEVTSEPIVTKRGDKWLITFKKEEK